jgi:hypothetical protein
MQKVVEHGWVYARSHGIKEWRASFSLSWMELKVGSPGSKFVLIKPFGIHILPT